ncbi:hypothetical protein EG830_06660, partial [bacterium]|nr:hypothetical protein [bacterium]
MKVLRLLLTPAVMGVLFVVLAVAMAAATFIENDFGPDAARSTIYNARWFELLFLLLTINLAGQIVVFRLYRREKLTVMLFHTAFIVMIAGAAITRYTGYDGMMHIREGETTSVTSSSGNSLTFELSDRDGTVLASHSRAVNLTGSRKASYRKSLEAAGEEVTLRLERYLPGAVRQVKEAPDGVPAVSFLATPDMVSSDIIALTRGETGFIGEMSIGFDTEADLNISNDGPEFFIRSLREIRSTSMQDMQTTIYPPDTLIVLSRGTVYTVGGYRIMPQVLTLNGIVVPSEEGGGRNAGGALECSLSGAGFDRKIFLWDDTGEARSEWNGSSGNLTAKVSYGSRALNLPFSLKLDDFMIERYPGSNSPSGFKSRVTLTDPENNTEMQYDIYMNHILKYRGFRFYQSSYDNDELGTILSVNHDPAGMYSTYAGYGLLFLFIILSIFNRKSSFRTIRPGYWNSGYRKPVTTLLFLFLISVVPARSQRLVIEKEAADRFGEVLAQDQKGRTKPLYTISSDILRKVARENSFDGLSPMQVFLGCSLDFFHWQDVPLIKVSNDEVRQLLKLTGEKAAFSDIVTFGAGGGYKLSDYVEKAYAKAESERTRFDKEVIKVDERVNICYMMSRGDFMRIFPLRDGTDHWGMAADAVMHNISSEDSLFVLS